MKVPGNCARCGAPFLAWPCRKKKYCSSACAYVSFTRPDIECGVCAKMFWPAFPGVRFCSVACGNINKTIAITYEMVEMRSIPEPNTGCWLWLGALNTEFYAKKTKTLIARSVLELNLGRRLTRREVTRHICDNPPCVNPAHLIVGTDADNSMDRTIRGRVARGSTAGNVKLKEADIPEIIARCSAGASLVSVAHDYGITANTITNIMKGRAWNHISGFPRPARAA